MPIDPYIIELEKKVRTMRTALELIAKDGGFMTDRNLAAQALEDTKDEGYIIVTTYLKEEPKD